MDRNVEIHVKGKTFSNPKVRKALKAKSGVRGISVAMSLLNVALLTRPPRSSGLSLAETWAWLRYIPSIASTSDLRLKADWDDLDAHQKTILSDDWGVGFGATIVGEALDVVAWAHTKHAMSIAGKRLGSLTKKKAKRGPAKCPDYLGLTKRSEIVVLECKGTQSSRKFSSDQMTKGVRQKNSLRLTTPPLVAMVSGLYVPGASAAESARLCMMDPPIEAGVESSDVRIPDDLAAVIVRTSLASSLQWVMPQLVSAELADPDRSGRERLSDEARELVARHRSRSASIFLSPGVGKLGKRDATELHAEIAVSEEIASALRDSTIDEACLGLLVAARKRRMVERRIGSESTGSDGSIALMASRVETSLGISLEVRLA